MATLLIIAFAFAANLPLGWRRAGYEKFTLPWWLLIHASVPFIIALRVWMDTPLIFTPLFILFAISGQFVGQKMAVGGEKRKKRSF